MLPNLRRVVFELNVARWQAAASWLTTAYPSETEHTDAGLFSGEQLPGTGIKRIYQSTQALYADLMA